MRGVPFHPISRQFLFISSVQQLPQAKFLSTRYYRNKNWQNQIKFGHTNLTYDVNGAHFQVVIGPATVGGIQAGAFKIGDTAGTIDNIIQCKLYRPGSVGFVTKSGGMSNELYNTIACVTDGIYEGIAIGGDVFPGSTLSDHVLRFNNIPQVIDL
ncbi:ATP-citrate synthase beta chain protein 1 [Capsicum chinense]|nr:ATP-citrate synthase beta chain protein 1 [Capsicum chinense]